jgi:hypothetical protein
MMNVLALQQLEAAVPDIGPLSSLLSISCCNRPREIG